MKYLLLDVDNTFNYGSMMMAENFIWYSSKSADNLYYIVASDEIHVTRLIEATGLKDRIIWISNKDIFKYSNRIINYSLKKVFHKSVISDLLQQMDKVIYFGGDDLTEIYGKKLLIKNVMYLNTIYSSNIEMDFVGQSIGPFSNSFIEKSVIKLLNKSNHISLRERLSYEYVKNNVKAANVVLMQDLALLPLAKEPETSTVRDNIIICPSELMYRHSKGIKRDEFIDYNVRLCEYVAENFADKKLIIIPHVWNDNMVNGDLNISKEIFAKIHDNYKHKIIGIFDKPLLPFEIRKVMNESCLVIAQRMHPAISSLETGVIPLVYSYGRKYEGIFNDLYKLNECMLDIRKYENTELLFEDTISILQYITKNRTALNQKIVSVNQKVRPVIKDYIKKFNINL